MLCIFLSSLTTQRAHAFCSYVGKPRTTRTWKCKTADWVGPVLKLQNAGGLIILSFYINTSSVTRYFVGSGKENTCMAVRHTHTAPGYMFRGHKKIYIRKVSPWWLWGFDDFTKSKAKPAIRKMHATKIDSICKSETSGSFDAIGVIWMGIWFMFL